VLGRGCEYRDGVMAHEHYFIRKIYSADHSYPPFVTDSKAMRRWFRTPN
jgi:hypothetical protein